MEQFNNNMSESYPAIYQNARSARENRMQIAKILTQDVELQNESFQALAKLSDKKIHSRISWAIDLAIELRPDLFLDRLPFLINEIKRWTDQSSLRSLLRACVHLIEYDDKITQPLLPEKQKKALIEPCFDLLLSQHPVAVKVHAMQLLFDLKELKPWVEEALIIELKNNIEHQSPAYKARAKMILNKCLKKARDR
ncbi:MAG: hypothetical protein ACPGRE_05350 [Flavobacteriaceae bacterium]